MHPFFPKQQFMLSVTSPRKTKDGATRTRYFYGETLKEAMKHAGIKPGQGFCYAKFGRGPVAFGEMVRDGIYTTTYRKDRK